MDNKPFRFSDQLDHYQKYKNGWDGYEGKAPTIAALATAANFCAIPLPCGGLQIEMSAGGADIEIGIAQSGKVDYVSWSRPERK